MDKKVRNIQNLFEFLKNSVKNNPKWAIASAGSMIGMDALSSITPIVAGASLSVIQGSLAIPPAVAVGTVIGWSCAMPLLENVCFFGRSVSNRVADFFYQKLGCYVLEKNLENTLNLPPLVQKQKTEKKLSDLISKTSESARKVAGNVSEGLLQTATFGISAIALSYLYWPLALGSAGMMGIKTYISIFASKQFKKYQEELQSKRTEYQAKNRDVMANFRNVKAMGQTGKVLAEVKKRNDMLFNLEKKLEVKRKKIELLNTIIDIGIAVGITIPSVFLLLSSKDIGQFFMVTGSAYRSLYSGSAVVRSIVGAQTNYQEYASTIRHFEYDKTLDRKTGEKQLDHVTGRIQFRDVSFKYPDVEIEKDGQSTIQKGSHIFKNFSADIMPGERVAVIGPSGMGKSTLVSLLSHDYEIQEGRIMVDDHNIQEVTEDSLCRAIHYLDQEPTFFEQESIEYNLKFFKSDATQAEIADALKKADLYDELMSKDSQLDGKTTELSPGQCQRLAIACAFLKDSPILILDEPTSKLDVEGQKAILNSIRQFSQDKTVIFVSHVPAEIATASRVLVMDKGKVIEDGAPVELMRNKESVFRTRYLNYKKIFDAERAEQAESHLENVPQEKTPQATGPAFVRLNRSQGIGY